MPIVILLVGIIFFSVGMRNTSEEFIELIKGDFTGTGSFIPWITSLFFLFILGSIPGFRPVSRGLIILVIMVLFLKRGTGFFDQFNKQLGIK